MSKKSGGKKRKTAGTNQAMTAAILDRMKAHQSRNALIPRKRRQK